MAKNAVQSEWTKRDGISFWLDADTFKIASPNTDMHTTDGTTLADVNAYAEKIRKRPIVAVLINPPPAN